MKMDSQQQLEDLMGQLGEFGRYQFKQTFLSGLAWFLAGLHIMGFVFVFPVLEHRCYVQEFDGYRNTVNETLLHSDNADIRMHIPTTDDGRLHSCLKYEDLNASKTGSCENGYVYNSTYFASSRVSDWDMVCEKQWMRALLQSIFLFGTLVGAFFSGLLADKFGRKPIFCISGILQCFCGMAGAFLNNYVQLAVSMLLYGMFGASGAAVPAVALTMEVVGASKRNVCGTMLTVWFGLGAVVVAMWAFFLPTEAKQLQLIYALHSILLFGHYWLMDESICWLWTNGRKAEALKIAEEAVKLNGKSFENRYSLSTSPTSKGQDDQNQNKTKSVVATQAADDHDQTPKARALDLVRYPKLRQRTLVMLYCWFACTLTYFGLSFNSVNLFGNPFIMFIINILAEIPAHLISIFVVSKTGNKPMFSGSLFLTGVGCILVGVLPAGITTIAVSMSSKVAATVAFNVINSYTAELFPTSLRNTAIGFCVMAARFGGAILPEINLLSTAAEEIPTITFGTAGILASLFALFMLPETMNRKIPQTVDDVEKPSKEEESEKNGSVFPIFV